MPRINTWWRTNFKINWRFSVRTYFTHLFFRSIKIARVEKILKRPININSKVQKIIKLFLFNLLIDLRFLAQIVYKRRRLRKHFFEVYCICLRLSDRFSWLVAKAIKEVHWIVFRALRSALRFWNILRKTSPQIINVGLLLLLSRNSRHWTKWVFCIEIDVWVSIYWWAYNLLR